MQSKPCFFSEIETRNGCPAPSQSNSTVFFTPGQSQVSIQVNHGMTFSLPMNHPISNVFPLPEGLLIETQRLQAMSTDSLKRELIDSTSSRNGKGENRGNPGLLNEQPRDSRFSYFSLNFHPLNQMYCVRVVPEEKGDRRESISKGMGFGGQPNVFSSDVMSTDFPSDAQFINSEVRPAPAPKTKGTRFVQFTATASNHHLRPDPASPQVLLAAPEHA